MIIKFGGKKLNEDSEKDTYIRLVINVLAILNRMEVHCIRALCK
jgi:hypothetical protein